MSLPPPSSGVRWKDYEIDTPTFRLMPIEKPDMSPFLVHMTGKNQIHSILRGDSASLQILKGHGYLKASIPANGGAGYDAKVVCFTESPTFALDFFRYRSFPRWQADQRFGIGFDKSKMVVKGVRPVIYADEELVNTINTLHHRIRQKDKGFSQNNFATVNLTNLVEKIYPLLFPLLECEPEQGYMWEREWRYPDPNGLAFDYQNIKVICCPENEEDKIRRILGATADNIDFIRAWREYDDVTDYLTRQQSVWRTQSQRFPQPTTNREAIRLLEERIKQYTIALNSLDAYKEVVSRFSRDMSRVEQEKKTLAGELSGLQKQLENLKKKKTASVKK
jgi:hypothetical protein